MSSNASQVILLIAQEASFAAVPDQSATLRRLRFTSLGGPGHEKIVARSAQIRGDRNKGDLIEVGKSAKRELSCEFSCQTFDDLILAALMDADWRTGVEVVQATASASAQTVTATSGTFSAALRQAKWVKLAGFSNTANNGNKRLLSATSSVLTVAPGSLVADQAGADILAAYRYCRNGITRRSFLIEEQHRDTAPAMFLALVGIEVDRWRLIAAERSRLMQSFDLEGARGFEAESSFGNGTPVEPNSAKVCNTSNNLGIISVNGTEIASVISFELNLENGLRKRPAVTRETTLQHGSNWCSPDGKLTAYFETPELYRAFLNHADVELLLPIKDADGNVSSIHLPCVKLTTGVQGLEGADADVILALDFEGQFSTTAGYSVQVDSLDAEAPDFEIIPWPDGIWGDDFQSYTDGTPPVNSLNGGTGFGAPWCLSDAQEYDVLGDDSGKIILTGDGDEIGVNL